eukprot:m.177048 g.177048  ORF g.177048 m.177048 type:complete len:774 (+) comp14276_c0_seq1:253-2574(+)
MGDADFVPGGALNPKGNTARKHTKMTRVKNKSAANVQITAEQLLREAQERQLEAVAPTPRQNLTDPEEIAEFRMKQRQHFEDAIRKNRGLVGNWIKYAAWEDKNQEYARARSIYERALDVEYRNVTLWLKYAEMEMRQKQVNHARNIWDRAVTIMPRVNTFWQKYTYMEEILGNVVNARQIFERWMQWHPDEQAWQAYINFEFRYKEFDKVRAIYERFLQTHGEVKHWLKYANFEKGQGNVVNARAIYERAAEYFGEEDMDPDLYLAFAKFEEGCKEHERARAIYQLALSKIPKARAEKLFNAFAQYEKKYGDRTRVEGVIVNKRKFMYEEEVKENPSNYDAWFDYIRLSEEMAREETGSLDDTREVYERAIANTPPSNTDKNVWRRYIYLWINYAVFEELLAKDPARAREVYKAALKVIPHKHFTFAKVWLFYAKFEIRQKDVKAARKVLGTALGKCPTEKLFKGYIELELQLREFDRCRALYNKYLEFNPANCQTWTKYSELEAILGDVDRARAIYELAVEQPLLDMPEVLWKAYIDFETELEQYDRARDLYERLLKKTNHVKVWISFAEFEASVDHEDMVPQARSVYEAGEKEVKRGGDKAQRLLLLESWKEFEDEFGTPLTAKRVADKMPRRVRRRREIIGDDGTSEGWEEYHDYIFPDEEAAGPNLKLLNMAKMWKAKQLAAKGGDGAAAATDTGNDQGEVGGEDAQQATSTSDAPDATATTTTTTLVEPDSAEGSAAMFIAAKAFEGSKPGYKFQMGDSGLGYYRDA